MVGKLLFCGSEHRLGSIDLIARYVSNFRYNIVHEVKDFSILDDVDGVVLFGQQVLPKHILKNIKRKKFVFGLDFDGYHSFIEQIHQDNKKVAGILLKPGPNNPYQQSIRSFPKHNQGIDYFLMPRTNATTQDIGTDLSDFFSGKLESNYNTENEVIPIHSREIRSVLGNINADDVYAWIVYDPNQKSIDGSMISISSHEKKCWEAIESARNIADNSASRCVRKRYKHNGSVGQVIHLWNDFNVIARAIPKQEGVCYIPLPGLVSSDEKGNLRIAQETLETCVKYAKLARK